MNVSLPNIAAHAAPAKTLPGTTTLLGKFSTLLAEAQDTADPSIPDLMSDIEKQLPKKMSAKNDKSGKPSGTQPDPNPLKAASGLDPVTHDSRPGLTSLTLSSAPVTSQKETAETDDSGEQPQSFIEATSGSGPASAFQLQLGFASPSIGSGPAASASTSNPSNILLAPQVAGSSQPEPGQTDPSNQAGGNEQAAVSSTNLSGTWMAPQQDPAPTNSEASATPDGKPATARIKTASGDSARSTSSALEAKAQAGFTFLQSHSASPAAPPNQITPDSPRNQQEKSVPLASSEAAKSGEHRKDFDIAGGGASPVTKGDSPSPAAAPAAGAGTSAGPATTPSATTSQGSASAEILSMVPDSHINTVVASVKTSDVLPHGQSTATAEDAEAIADAAALSASSPLHAAKLVAGMEQSELRVGLRSGEFGNVDIRTSLVHNQFTAEISVERGELGRALSAELPSLQHRLTEQNLPGANVTVQHDSSSGSAFQQGSREGRNAPPVDIASDRVQQEVTLPVLSVEVMEAANARLDIHM
ncbi:MAG: flagellar hook-length control protein FliK [Terriglobales bacterium]